MGRILFHGKRRLRSKFFMCVKYLYTWIQLLFYWIKKIWHLLYKETKKNSIIFCQVSEISWFANSDFFFVKSTAHDIFELSRKWQILKKIFISYNLINYVKNSSWMVIIPPPVLKGIRTLRPRTFRPPDGLGPRTFRPPDV